MNIALATTLVISIALITCGENPALTAMLADLPRKIWLALFDRAPIKTRRPSKTDVQ